HHSTHFRARTDFLARARTHSKIRILTNTEVRRVLGEERVEGIEIGTRGSSATRRLEARAIFVRIGWEPRTEHVRGQLKLDRAGYVRTSAGGATNVKGVFAAGDVCSPRWPSIANAAGQGAAAA